MIESFRDLDVWQKSMDLVERVYSRSSNWPRSETYGLASQIRRAAVSIPSNVAEGKALGGQGYPRHIKIALGSKSELETQSNSRNALGCSRPAKRRRFWRKQPLSDECWQSSGSHCHETDLALGLLAPWPLGPYSRWARCRKASRPSCTSEVQREADADDARRQNRRRQQVAGADRRVLVVAGIRVGHVEEVDRRRDAARAEAEAAR